MNKQKDWYEKSYRNSGFNAQRRYPNEELLRFMGANYFDKEIKNRKNIKILEVGCGSCSNLWMISKEGFDTYGLDLSNESLKLGQKMLNKWGVEAKLQQGSFLELPYDNNTFDVVIDVFSMNCVQHSDFLIAIDEAYRVLKKGGIFFSYTPSKASDAFINYLPAEKIDAFSLSGIYREGSPFSGNHYPFHFWEKQEYQELLIKKGFIMQSVETVKKSYSDGEEFFEHISLTAKK